MAQTEEKPPLKFWQNSEEFKLLSDTSKHRLDNVRQKWFNMGGTCTTSSSMQTNEHGEVEFWLNDNCTSRIRDGINAQEAIRLSIKHGDTGWWKIEDLEQLLQGYGKMFERAMWKNGFRRHKRNPNQWSRRKDSEQWIPEANLDPLLLIDPIDPATDEGKRLTSLIILPNQSMGTGRTMLFTVGKQGMIHGHLWVNPFGGLSAESMPAWMAQFGVRGHIAKEQDGFQIEAENIKLGKEKYIRIVTKGNREIECLWPTETPNQCYKTLAEYVAFGKPVAQ